MLMHEPLKNNNQTEIKNRKLSERTSAELTELIAQFQKANDEIRDARRAALNVMEDAILAKEALRESEERLQLSLRGANIYTWELNPQTGKTIFSDNHKEVLGFEVSQVSLDNYLDIHPDDKDSVADAVKQSINNRVPLDIEHRII